MGIDSSIYFQQRTPDIVGSIQRGMQLKSLLDNRNELQKQRERQEGLRGAYAQGMEIGNDGNVTYNPEATIGALVKGGYGPEAFQAKMQMDEQSMLREKSMMEKQFNQLDLTSRLLGSATDQNSWNRAIQDAENMGINVDQYKGVPFDKNLRDDLLMRSLSAKEQLQQRLDQQKLAQQKRQFDQKIGLQKSKLQGPSLTEFQKADQKAAAKRYGEIQEAVPKTNEAIDAVNDALEAQLKYSEDYAFGTGPISTAFGLEKYINQDAENLNAKMKKVNLKNMTQTFAGMAKAIDSDAERRAWDGTQPDITNDDSTNVNILLGQKSVLLKDKAEAAAQRRHVARYGNLDNYKSPVDGKLTTVVAPDGELILVDKNKEKELKKRGYSGLDEYSRKVVKYGREGYLRRKAREVLANRRRMRNNNMNAGVE